MLALEPNDLTPGLRPAGTKPSSDHGVASRPLDAAAIKRRLQYAPPPPSLSSVNDALCELLTAEQSHMVQISEIARSVHCPSDRTLSRIANLLAVYLGPRAE